ncbi:MAG: type II toxin-antitoxin system VapC family toxin [Pseudomonadales bacterium]|nr:type II toxin-antitoxin system VapC family toxin [Candidatus Woesebacteria bacterium]MCB9801816.1 type II toxin-antitoxin system VapC family toxin [Pseudomonadales bacterium]
MQYLLDTNIIIKHLRRQQKVDPRWLEKECGVSLFTYAELLYGCYRSANPLHEQRILDETLELLDISVVDIGLKEIELYIQIKVNLEKKGQKPEDFDLLIAATALGQDLTLITNNAKHFKRISGLRVLATEPEALPLPDHSH